MGGWRTDRRKKKREELDLGLLLYQFDISFRDAKKLSEYQEVDYFVKKIQRLWEVKQIYKKLLLAEVLLNIESAKNKKTYSHYIRWRQGLIDRIEELSEDEEEMTVFEKLRRRKPKRNTVFDRFKRLKKG